MPVTKSAIKKLGQDRKREVLNDTLRRQLKEAVKKTKKKEEKLDKAFSVIDKAAKNKLIHKNKAARLKSSLSKIMPSVAKKSSTTKEKPVKKTAAVKKTASPKKSTTPAKKTTKTSPRK